MGVPCSHHNRFMALPIVICRAFTGVLTVVHGSGGRRAADAHIHRLTLDDAVYSHDEHGAMPHAHTVRRLPMHPSPPMILSFRQMPSFFWCLNLRPAALPRTFHSSSAVLQFPFRTVVTTLASAGDLHLQKGTGAPAPGSAHACQGGSRSPLKAGA